MITFLSEIFNANGVKEIHIFLDLIEEALGDFRFRKTAHQLYSATGRDGARTMVGL